MTDPLVGTRLDEYLLEDLLGHGGMARVYRGLDTGLKRYAAVKVIDTPHQQDADYIARFEKEARAIAQLDHPHIVTVYRYGDAGQLLYLAMKYVEGADLHAVLSSYEADKQLMPDDEVMRLLREIGSALDYAHSQGVVHRDIKPSNIMLDPQGRAFLTDFGLALLTEVGTRGEILGSPHYIAPEQAVSSAGAVAQSDLYALGVILYRMVTGTLPFDDEDVLELLMLHMTALPPSPRTMRAEISPAVEEVLLKALAKEPADRYQSGMALADAYAEALANATAVPLAAAAPTLTIMDRVALDMETLPPPNYETFQLATESLAATPAVAATQTAAQPEETTNVAMDDAALSGRRIWPIVAIVAVLLLLCLGAFMLRGRIGNEEEGVAVVDPTSEVVESTAEVVEPISVAASAVETPENEEAVVVETAVVEEVVAEETAVVDNESTGELSSEQTTGTSSSIYIPIVSNQTDSIQPTASETGEATAPAQPTAAPADTSTPVTYQLLIAMKKEDSLFMVNQSGQPIPLELLWIGNNKGEVSGTEWGLNQLNPGECVTVWKDGGKPKAPDVECNEVGEVLTREGSQRFWKDAFDIFYDDEEVAQCDSSKSCEIEFTP